MSGTQQMDTIPDLPIPRAGASRHGLLTVSSSGSRAFRQDGTPPPSAWRKRDVRSSEGCAVHDITGMTIRRRRWSVVCQHVRCRATMESCVCRRCALCDRRIRGISPNPMNVRSNASWEDEGPSGRWTGLLSSEDVVGWSAVRRFHEYKENNESENQSCLL